jgi:hypothetical protein
MARYAPDGKIRMSWVVTIANKAAPTVAELNAGTLLSPFTTKDGVDPGLTTNMVDSATIEETFDAQGVGSYGGTLKLTMYRDDTADTAWNLMVYGTIGFVVVRRGIASATAYANPQKCEVYPAQMHEPIPQVTASNEQTKFQATFAVTSAPSLKATIT